MGTVAEVKNKVNGSKILTVYDFLEKKKELLSQALPKHIGIDRLGAMFTITVRSNPELANCSPASLIGCLVQTVQFGLIPGNAGHCFYIPFNNKKKDGTWQREAQFILGYLGIVELINRSKLAAILSCEVVYSKDFFEYECGLNSRLKHIPEIGDRGEKIGVYCIAKNLLANEKVFIYLQKEEVEKVKAASKGAKSGFSPWNTDWEPEMWKKTAIRRIRKLLPLSIDVQKKLSSDETVKTEIAKDMTSVPDETNWEEGELVPSAENVPPEASQAPKTGIPEAEQEINPEWKK